MVLLLLLLTSRECRSPLTETWSTWTLSSILDSSVDSPIKSRYFKFIRETNEFLRSISFVCKLAFCLSRGKCRRAITQSTISSGSPGDASSSAAPFSWPFCSTFLVVGTLSVLPVSSWTSLSGPFVMPRSVSIALSFSRFGGIPRQ